MTSARFYQGSPSDEQTVYTCPHGSRATVVQVVAANTADDTASFSLSLVPEGDTAGPQNRLADALGVAAHDSAVLDLAQVLHAGDTLSAAVSDPGVTLTISGSVERT